MKKIFQKYGTAFLFLCFTGSLFFLGFAAGTLKEKLKKSTFAPGFALENTPSPEIPIFFFDKIENGVLLGHHKGQEARFVVGKGEKISSVHNEDFSFSVADILPNLKMIPAPKGMNFVGSSRGTKYWPLDAPEAALISVKNRTFFVTAEEAQKRGYKRGE